MPSVDAESARCFRLLISRIRVVYIAHYMRLASPSRTRRGRSRGLNRKLPARNRPSSFLRKHAYTEPPPPTPRGGKKSCCETARPAPPACATNRRSLIQTSAKRRHGNDVRDIINAGDLHRKRRRPVQVAGRCAAKPEVEERACEALLRKDRPDVGNGTERGRQRWSRRPCRYEEEEGEEFERREAGDPQDQEEEVEHTLVVLFSGPAVFRGRHRQDTSEDRGSRDRPAAFGKMDGAKRAQEAGGGGGGAATRLETRGDACGGRAVVWFGGVGERADTNFERSPRPGAGYMLGHRSSGHRLQASLDPLFLTESGMGKRGGARVSLVSKWGKSALFKWHPYI